MSGLPLEQAIKMIEVDPNLSIAEIKKTVKREYKLNPILAIQFIFQGKVLPDQLKFAKLGIHPKKDVITIMATQAGPLLDERIQRDKDLFKNLKIEIEKILIHKVTIDLKKIDEIQRKIMIFESEIKNLKLNGYNKDKINEFTSEFEKLKFIFTDLLRDRRYQYRDFIIKDSKKKRLTSLLIFIISFITFLSILIIFLSIIL